MSIKSALLASTLVFSASVNAFSLTSHDIQEGHSLSKTFVNSGWGCSGKNMSPQLAWHDIPKGTKSFAVTVFDPDAPTGSGFWQWVVINLPVDVVNLPRGANISRLGGVEIRNDYGALQYGGACPPKGGGMHRYEFTVWALPVSKLAANADVTPAVVGFELNKIALGKAQITSIYTK